LNFGMSSKLHNNPLVPWVWADAKALKCAAAIQADAAAATAVVPAAKIKARNEAGAVAAMLAAKIQVRDEAEAIARRR
jgi:hypothetical protein